MRRMRQVMLIGIDERTQSEVGDFCKYLQHPGESQALSFYAPRRRLRHTRPSGRRRIAIRAPKWRRPAGHRRRIKEPSTIGSWQEIQREQNGGRPISRIGRPPSPLRQRLGGADRPVAAAASDKIRFSMQRIRSTASRSNAKVFDPAKEQFTGVILGIALASFRDRTGTDRFLLLPGDDVKLTFPNAGIPPKAISDTFTIVDFYESKMSEYDSNFVFVPIRKLQELRGMIDPQTGIGNVTAIQIKLKPGADADAVCDKLRAEFPNYAVSTWRDKQGPLLAAVQMESAVLNMLLFMIIAVAGFGILAIFFMIVVEKTRDIGILKSLGASSGGIMGIFLSYGLSLGIVGSGVGMIIGLLFVHYINDDSQRSRMAHRPKSVRSGDLLLLQDSDDRRAGHRRVDRRRSIGDRGDGEHFAGPACRTAASRGGPAL